MRTTIVLFLLMLSSVGFAQKATKNTALVIIDMQPIFYQDSGYLEFSDNREKVQELLEQQVAAIQEAKKNKIPIVLVELHNQLIPAITIHPAGFSP